jgi:lipoprotein-anchoring transpeptidase ErfK/SrfK
MSVRIASRGLIVVLSFAAALAGVSAPGSAQDYRGWGWNDGYDGPPARRLPFPPQYEDFDDYEPEDDAPPVSRRDRDRDWRDADDDDEVRRRRARNRQYDRRYEWQPSDDFDEDDEGARGRDTPREPKPGEQSAGKTKDGGPRPQINPVAPPRVAFRANYPAGSVVIDQRARKLYFVLNTNSAYVYPIGVGREGFSWTGSEKVSRIADWPDWYPPAEMRKRKPELPEHMLGGLYNPLGAKAIYLGNTLYRIHGTNEPKSIGRAESSGCFRMLNAHVLHLAELVKPGTPVTVVGSLAPKVAASEPAKVQPKPVRPRPQRKRAWDWDLYPDYGR